MGVTKARVPTGQDPRLIRGLREQSSPGDILFASMGFGSLPAPDPKLYPRTSESGVAGGGCSGHIPSFSLWHLLPGFNPFADQQDGRKKEVLTVWVEASFPEEDIWLRES